MNYHLLRTTISFVEVTVETNNYFSEIPMDIVIGNGHGSDFLQKVLRLLPTMTVECRARYIGISLYLE